MDKIKTIVVEDVALELKGTLSIIRNEIPEIEIIGTAQTEREFRALMDGGALPDLVLLDLGLGGSTTVGVDCSMRSSGLMCLMPVLTAWCLRRANCLPAVRFLMSWPASVMFSTNR